MTSHNITYFDLTAEQPEVLQRFYESVFGWGFSEPDEQGYRMIDTDGSGNPAGGIGSSEDGSPTGFTFYVDVDDLQQRISAATAGGGSVIMEPMELPGFGSIAVIADPEGNPLGIWKR